MNKKEVITKLLDSKKAAILNIILHSKEELYLKEISQKANVSMASTFRILQEFVTLDLITKRQWKTSKVYACKDSKQVQFLKDLFHQEFDGINEFINILPSEANVSQVIKHGTSKKGKANLLLIGNNIKVEPVESTIQKIQEKGFEISYLTLTQQQYDQMSKMGLYAGEKKIIK